MTASRDERAVFRGVANSKTVISFGNSVFLLEDIRSISIFGYKDDDPDVSVVVCVGPDQVSHQFVFDDDTSGRAEFDRIKALWEDHCNQYQTQ